MGIGETVLKIIIGDPVLSKKVERKQIPASEVDIPLEELGDLVETTFGDYALRIKRLYVLLPDSEMEATYGEVKHGGIHNYGIPKQFDITFFADFELEYIPEGLVHPVGQVRLAHTNKHLCGEGADGSFRWDFGTGQRHYYFIETLPDQMKEDKSLRIFGKRVVPHSMAKGKYSIGELFKPLYPELASIAEKYLLDTDALRKLPRSRTMIE